MYYIVVEVVLDLSLGRSKVEGCGLQSAAGGTAQQCLAMKATHTLSAPLNAVPVASVPDAEAAQEKRALCISIASLVLSVPALIGA